MNKLLESLETFNSLILCFINSILKSHYILFVIYLLLNIVDGITGLIKARINHSEISEIVMKGILKKIGHWLIVFLAFMLPVGFKELGEIIKIDLSITIYLGWFVLSSLIVNEYRSIIENLVESGCSVPSILIKGVDKVSNQLEQYNNKNNM